MMIRNHRVLVRKTEKSLSASFSSEKEAFFLVILYRSASPETGAFIAQGLCARGRRER
ncbi:MAG TPA: hypothetical protein VG848_04250 [Acetobacteraceae bacterium]|nr:hypothetical protein [Acetobacteraceae bacterium]